MVEREYQPENQEVLRWRQAYYVWPHLSASEEASIWPA
jgi:hypothetical protein